jgi:hypothetical protein
VGDCGGNGYFNSYATKLKIGKARQTNKLKKEKDF